MVKDCIQVSMALNIRVNLKMIYKMAKVKKNGMMDPNLKENMLME